MKYIFILLLGILLGVGAVWYYQDSQRRNHPENIADKLKSSAQSAGAAIADQWHKLRIEDITNELAQTGRVIREKAEVAGTAVANATSDARITAAIKARLVADSGLASLSISVNTTGGVVTLAGWVTSPDQIRKAVSIALDAEGVRKVVSTLQIKAG